MDKLVVWLQRRRAKNAGAASAKEDVGKEQEGSDSAERNSRERAAANAALRRRLESQIGVSPLEPEPELDFSGSDTEEAIGTGLRPRQKFVADDDTADAGPYREPEPESEQPHIPYKSRRSAIRGGVLTLEMPDEVPRYKGVSREGTRTPGGEEPPVGSGDIRVYTMSFNMECGDPTKWKCDFIPRDCDVYVIGLQEAGGENITSVPESPRPTSGKKPGTEETLYNMIESYLLEQCGALAFSTT